MTERRIIRFIQLSVWDAVLLLCAVAPIDISAAQPQAAGVFHSPNIIFILADDMGYGDLGCYGATKIKTPNIDRLAEEGILFTDGHCGASTCTPTRYGLMTGRHAWRSWCKYSALSTNAPLLIEEDRVTIASFLKSAGYSTSIVGKWHLGYGREEGFEKNRGDTPPNYWDTRGRGPDWNGELKPGPFENGFDYSYVIPVANSFPPYVFIENDRVAGLRKDSPIGKLESRNYGKMAGGEGARWTDEELIDKFTDKLVSELERLAAKPKPFFLYYTPTQPHIGSRVVNRNAHWPNERFKGASQAGNYGDVVQELDWSVGEILKTLDQLGLTEDTLVIFTSDNGGYTRNFNGHQPNGPILRGGKGDLVEGGIRVPFLARWPGKIKPGTRSKEVVSTTDLLATVAGIVGKELPAGAGPDSYNVLPALLGQTLPHPGRAVVLSSGGTGAISIRAGKWKLIEGQGNCGYGEFRAKRPVPAPAPGDPPVQLYNMEVDLGEANNLYRQHPEIVHRLKATLEKIKADEHYHPTTLEQPTEQLSNRQLDGLFARVEGPLQTKAQPSAAQRVDVLPAPDGKVADMSKPVQVFILLGQSNMLGFGRVNAAKGKPDGSLTHAVNEKGLYPYLVDGKGVWTERKDVRNVRVMGSGTGGMRLFNNEWMTIKGGKIGPEIGIGHHLGHAIDAPVMILKSCIGNRALGWDLLPPGGEGFEFTDVKGVTWVHPGYRGSPERWEKGTEPKKIKWYAGMQYDGDIARAKKVLSELDKYYPGATEYVIAGFCWWQGDRDSRSAALSSRYEKNLVHLIKQLRKDFDAPNAKFVAATLGQTAKGATDGGGKLLDAMFAVDGTSGKYPEFKGNVATVYSHPLSKGGSSGAHYGGNAETYMNVGEAMGRAMVRLIEAD